MDEEGLPILTARRIIEKLLAEKKPIHIWGPPGVGKSELVEQIANDRGISLVDIRVTLFDQVDLRGLPKIDGDTTRWLPPEELPDAKRHGKKGFLFLDELNVAPQAVQAACYQLILNRRLGKYVLPDGWNILAAGNQQKHKAAAQRMPSALANRFAHVFIKADLQAWLYWAASNNIHPFLMAFLRWKENLLFSMEGDLITFPTPRSWTGVSPFCDDPDIQLLARSFVGEGPAMELAAFIETYKNLPTRSDIEKKPKTTALVEEPSARYLIVTAMSKWATVNNIDALWTYAARVGKEHEIIFMTDAVKRDPSLTNTKAYVKFNVENQSLRG